MTTTRRRYRLRIATADADPAAFSDPAVATGNEFVAHSVRDGENPYIEAAPEGDGQELDPITGKATIGEVQVRVIDARLGDDQTTTHHDFYLEYSEDIASAESNAARVAAFRALWTPRGTSHRPVGNPSGDAEIQFSNNFSADFPWDASTNPETAAGYPNAYGADAPALLRGFASFGGHFYGDNVGTWARTFSGFVPGEYVKVGLYVQLSEFSFSSTQENQFRAEANGVPVFDIATAPGSPGANVDQLYKWLYRAAWTIADENGDVLFEVGLFGSETTPDTDGSGDNGWRVELDHLTLTTGLGDGDRVVTRELADAEGYWHLLSRLAAVELSEDDGEVGVLTWTAITVGYLNALRLPRALVWDLTVGETRRAELRAELWRDSPVPVDTGDVLISPTCLWGGPIVTGAAYNTPTETFAGVKDYGPVRVEVIAQTGHSARQVDLNMVGGWLPPFYAGLLTAAGNGNNDVEVSYPNHHARQFFEWDPETWAYDGGQQSTVYGYFPGLVVQLTRVSDGETFYTVPLAVAARKSSSYLLKPPTDDPVGTYDNLIERNVELRVDWDATVLGEAKPGAGVHFDVRIWPARPSKEFPVHVRGHPVAIVEYHAAQFGVRLDAASAAAAETAINTRYGGDVVLELTYESHRSFERDHTQLLAFFGFALRPTVTGEAEFVGLRYAVPTVTTPITLEDLRDDDAPIFELSEDSIITTAETKTLKYLFTIAQDGDDVEGAFSDYPPDLLQKADDVVTGATDDTVDPGDQRTHTWDLPGRVLVDGIPIDIAGPAVAAGDWLVNWRRRGAAELELRVLPSGDREVGSDVVLDLPHLPVAVPSLALTLRGGGPVAARVLRRTPVVAGADLALIFAPPADQVALDPPTGGAPPDPTDVDPEFTLTAAAADPTRVVIVTLTNPDDFDGTGLSIAWQWGVGVVPPEGHMAHRVSALDPDAAALGFTLPTVPAGSTVWARATPTAPGGRTRLNWTAWQSITLGATTGVVYADFGAGLVPITSDFGAGETLVTGTF